MKAKIIKRPQGKEVVIPLHTFQTVWFCVAVTMCLLGMGLGAGIAAFFVK